MDNVTRLSADDFIANLTHAHKANELERAMVTLLSRFINDNEINSLNDIHNYGTPWLGSDTVIERFTKLNGLVVLRRPDYDALSDKIMSVIYANWIALASERGLAFLQFVLDMLYPNKNTIVRLYHSKSHASEYPEYLSEHKRSDRFLTSRIRIKLGSDVNIAEVAELQPTLTRLVPWQIVPQIAIGFETEPVGYRPAIVCQRFHVANFSPF